VRAEIRIGLAVAAMGASAATGIATGESGAEDASAAAAEVLALEPRPRVVVYE
jgi:hypothetical protein